jgi:TRAP-type C4-dicarboxylate transport system substrate-binding protein
MNVTAPVRRALLGAGAAAALAAPVDAETLRYATGFPPNTNPIDALEVFAGVAAEESDGALDIKIYPASLLGFLESSDGVRDGIADFATLLTPYFLSEYPATNLVTELASLMELREGTGDRASMAFVGALNEFVLLECGDCEAEFAEQNQVYKAAASTPPYILQCTAPVVTAADLKGTRIRAGGAWWSRWAEAMGATPVSMSVSDTFEALSQGVIDCTANSASDMSNFGFIDVVTDLTLDIPGSQFAGGSTINRDAWAAMSVEEREAVMEAAAALAARMTWNYYEEGKRNLERAREEGIDLHQAEPALLEASRAFIERDVETMIASYQERFGVLDGGKKAERMRALIAKWSDLAQTPESYEDLRDLYRREIYSKVDVEDYGL